MQFIIGEGDEEKLVEPGVDDDIIERSLNGLFEKDGENRFAILVDEGNEPGNEEFYIQVLYLSDEYGKDEEGFVLEYRDGSNDKHYQCFSVSLGPVGLKEVTKAFIQYLHSKDEWKTSFEWERTTDF